MTDENSKLLARIEAQEALLQEFAALLIPTQTSWNTSNLKHRVARDVAASGKPAFVPGLLPAVGQN